MSFSLTETPPMRVLGISTNTRLLGLAILSEDGLEDYFIRLYKSSWSPDKATLMVSSLEPCVRKYSITHVLLSIPLPHYHTKELGCLINAFAFFCKEHKLVLKQLPETMLDTLHQPTRKRKQALMEALVLRYPELWKQYEKECRNKHSYHIKLFEAVGMATLGYEGM